jgi:biopolymer transport protein ExbB
MSVLDAIGVVFSNAPLIFFLLFILSVLSLAFFFERLANVKVSKVLPKNFEQIKADILSKNTREVIHRLQRDNRYLSKEIKNLLEIYLEGKASKEDLLAFIRYSLAERLYNHLSRRVSFISMSVTLATLIGLAGTVFGLIEVFSAFYHSNNPQAYNLLAKGIALSLNSTALGLFVAIINFILYWFIKERINSVLQKILLEIENLFVIL